MTIDPHDIHRLDQAAPDALQAVDALAADEETRRRLEAKGEAIYGMELTRDLANATGHAPMSLAGWAAFATIRLVQAHSDLERVTAERDQARNDAKVVAADRERTRVERDDYARLRNRYADLLRAATTALGIQVIDAIPATATEYVDAARNLRVQLDRALAETSRLGAQIAASERLCALGELTAERDGLVETIGRLVSLPPEQIATMHKVGYNDTSAHGLGSTPRAQETVPSGGPCGTCWACQASRATDPLARVVRNAIDWQACPDIAAGPLLEDQALREAVDELLAGPVCPAQAAVVEEHRAELTQDDVDRAATLAQIAAEAAQLDQDLADGRIRDELGTPDGSVIGVSSRYAHAAGQPRYARAAGHPAGGDWVRLHTGSGRCYEGYRSPRCPGDEMADHQHDIRCVDPVEG